jgi:cell division protein FtsB
MEEENRRYSENNGINEDSMSVSAEDEELSAGKISDEAAAPAREVYKEQSADEAFAAQVEQRRRARDKKRIAKKRRTVILLVIILALLMTMCGREIVRLKAENIALKKQQKELKAERDSLSEELEKSRDRDYVEEKARDQLRLLNDGEILFLFDEDNGSKDSKETENEDE